MAPEFASNVAHCDHIPVSLIKLRPRVKLSTRTTHITRAPHAQKRVARAEQGKKKTRGLYVLLGTEKKKKEQKANGGCALMCDS